MKRLTSTHRCFFIGHLLLAGLILLIVPGKMVASPVGDKAANEVDFAHEVVPLLQARCTECHANGNYKGGFSLDNRDALLATGAVEPGDSDSSYLMERVRDHDPDFRMPPKGPPLTPDEVDLLSQWIDAGVTWADGFSFKENRYQAPLKPRRPELPGGELNPKPIDRFLARYWQENDVEPTPLIDDAKFLRRVSLDIVGLLPTAAATQAFVTDGDPGKRRRVVRELLEDRQAYADHWLTFWNDLLRNDYAAPGGRKQVTRWLYSALYENLPYDQFVSALISPEPEAEGFIQGIQWRGKVNSSQTTHIQFAQNVGQVFLGVNLKCASCHDSFIDDWKLKDTYGLAAVISEEPLELHRCDKPLGEMAKVSFLFPELGTIDPEAPKQERLAQLAGLMTHADNGRLTRTLVNRLWHRFMGRAIVHPVDSMGNEPFDEDLLDYLAVHLSDNKFDVKKTIELIVTSDAYQRAMITRSSEPSADGFVFPGPMARRMTAEQFIDGIWQITQTSPFNRDALLDLPTNRPLSAKWIWGPIENLNDVIYERPAGEAFTFRKQFTLDSLPDAAIATVTCDNGYNLIVNGKRLSGDGDHNSVESVDLLPELKVGKNEFLISTRNAGSGSETSFAGLYLEARLYTDADDQTRDLLVIATDASWQATSSIPNSKTGLFKAGDIPTWKPAGVIEVETPFDEQVPIKAQSAFAAYDLRPGYFIRAGLMNSSPLMRVLGRPNREQVVTTRPEELSTLQALELSNGDDFNRLLHGGAKKLLEQHPDWTAPDFAEWITLSALGRPPTEEESEVLIAMAGTPVSEAGLTDMLWSVFMLPEFQMIQ